MTDELHIERNSGDITFKEWIDAVLKTEGASLEGNPEVGENPKTGQIVTVGGNPNNVAIIKKGRLELSLLAILTILVTLSESLLHLLQILQKQ